MIYQALRGDKWNAAIVIDIHISGQYEKASGSKIIKY